AQCHLYHFIQCVYKRNSHDNHSLSYYFLALLIIYYVSELIDDTSFWSIMKILGIHFINRTGRYITHYIVGWCLKATCNNLHVMEDKTAAVLLGWTFGNSIPLPSILVKIKLIYRLTKLYKIISSVKTIV
ncbi:hypothetical protein ACJX0J_006171, partial [Zea mays]